MRKTFLFLSLVILLIGSAISYSHSGGEHKEKAVGDPKSQHEEIKEHHGKMGVLHNSMAILNGHIDIIFHSIILSDFSKLARSANVVKKVAEGLKGTRPHKNLENVDRYGALIAKLEKEAREFEETLSEQNPLEVSQKFGSVIGVCVECHISFRD